MIFRGPTPYEVGNDDKSSLLQAARKVYELGISRANILIILDRSFTTTPFDSDSNSGNVLS